MFFSLFIVLLDEVSVGRVSLVSVGRVSLVLSVVRVSLVLSVVRISVLALPFSISLVGAWLIGMLSCFCQILMPLSGPIYVCVMVA